MLTEPKQAAGPPGSRVTPLTALIALAALATALPAWARWPWQHRPPAASTQMVSVLAVTAGSAAADASIARVASPAPRAGKVPIAQYWDRNTLLLDLTRLSGAGSATLTPVPANGGWPARLEFRVQPGAIARLQVEAAQRVTFIVPAHGAAEVLKLDPGVYLSDTAQIKLRWSAAGDLPR
ncbi:MAG: hypothetical protein ACRETK_09300 [Steroidobacteraceae bacterium]